MLKEISIEITRKCPNRCIHCSSSSTETCSEFIPIDLFEKVVKDAKNLGLKRVCFSGGEPFLHPEIGRMVHLVHNMGLESFIYSSGIYMDEEKNRIPIPSELISQISQDVTKIIFNIEGAEETIYDEIMGTHGCFKYLEESIRIAVAKGIYVEGHFVPNKINMHQIENTLAFCNKLGVAKVSFLRLVAHGRAQKNRHKLLMSEEEMQFVEKKLLEIKSSNIYEIRIGVPLLGETNECHCEAANGKLNIRYDGKVFPCEVFKNDQVSLLSDIEPDDIYSSPLDEIYHNSLYLKRTREIIKNFADNRTCEKCVGQYYLKSGRDE